MLSRVADSVYWMNRQIERAENVARAIETTLGLALEGTIEPGRLWNALVCAFGDQSDFWARHGLADQARVFDFLAFDPANPTASRFLDEDLNRVWDPALLDGPRASAELTRAREIRPAVEAADQG